MSLSICHILLISFVPFFCSFAATINKTFLSINIQLITIIEKWAELHDSSHFSIKNKPRDYRNNNWWPSIAFVSVVLSQHGRTSSGDNNNHLSGCLSSRLLQSFTLTFPLHPEWAMGLVEPLPSSPPFKFRSLLELLLLFMSGRISRPGE